MAGHAKVHGLQNSQQRPRTSLIGDYLDHRLIAPMLLPDETFWCEYAHQQIGTVLCGPCFTVINPDLACHTANQEKRQRGG